MLSAVASLMYNLSMKQKSSDWRPLVFALCTTSSAILVSQISGTEGDSHWRIQGGARDTPPLGTIFFSFSCSFQAKLAKMIGWHPTFGVGTLSEKSWILVSHCGSVHHGFSHSIVFLTGSPSADHIFKHSSHFLPHLPKIL